MHRPIFMTSKYVECAVAFANRFVVLNKWYNPHDTEKQPAICPLSSSVALLLNETQMWMSALSGINVSIYQRH